MTDAVCWSGCGNADVHQHDPIFIWRNEANVEPYASFEADFLQAAISIKNWHT
jgi:hypothetical protein